MISFKFSGHLNSNIYVRIKEETDIQKLWSSSLVPLILSHFSKEGLSSITYSIGCTIDSDECLNRLIELGCFYLDQNRMRQMFIVGPDSVLKVHLMPRRYDTKRFHFGNAVVFDSDDYIVVNKPSLLPVHPTVDNFKENLLVVLQTQLNQKLFSIHRLDVETTGLILFAKNETAMTYFNGLFADRKIRKFYKAVVSKTVPLGRKTHWMIKSKRSPKSLSDRDVANSSRVELEVVKNAEFGNKGFSVVDIELLTGKTHQIRAQLSHLGFPLVGDSLYGGADFPLDFEYNHFLLHSYRIEFLDNSGHEKKFELQPNWL